MRAHANQLRTSYSHRSETEISDAWLCLNEVYDLVAGSEDDVQVEQDKDEPEGSAETHNTDPAAASPVPQNDSPKSILKKDDSQKKPKRKIVIRLPDNQTNLRRSTRLRKPVDRYK